MRKHLGSIMINIFLPLLIGAIIYYLISPEVIFVKQIDSFFGSGLHVPNAATGNLIVKIMRNYLLDMMWGYALFFTLFYLLGNNAANLGKTFLIAVPFLVTVEMLQLTPIAKGTFDVCDILVECLAGIIAAFIIKKHFLRRKF
jgi:hypothetical protein